MNRPDQAKLPPLAQFEETIETADGRTLELHRDQHGTCWIPERHHGRHRVMPLAEYAWECHTAARILRAEQLKRLSARLRLLAEHLRAAMRRGGTAGGSAARSVN